MKLPHLALALVAALLPMLAGCGGAGGSAASAPAQKTEADALVGTYAAVAFTILDERGGAVSERDVVSYSGGLALRDDGSYVQTLLIDGVEQVEIGAWSAQYSVLTITPADGSCAYEASYRLHGEVLTIDAVYPCDLANRITRTWVSQ